MDVQVKQKLKKFHAGILMSISGHLLVFHALYMNFELWISMIFSIGFFVVVIANQIAAYQKVLFGESKMKNDHEQRLNFKIILISGSGIGLMIFALLGEIDFISLCSLLFGISLVVSSFHLTVKKFKNMD